MGFRVCSKVAPCARGPEGRAVFAFTLLAIQTAKATITTKGEYHSYMHQALVAGLLSSPHLPARRRLNTPNQRMAMHDTANRTHHSYMHHALVAGLLSSLHRSTTASTPPWHALSAPWQPTSSACRAASSVLEPMCLWSMAAMSSLRRSRGARKGSGCGKLQQQTSR